MENNQSTQEQKVEKRAECPFKSGFGKFFIVLFHVLYFVAVFAALIWIVVLLWNWLMPEIFGLATVSFWQALGLFALCKILFGKFGGHWHGRGHRHFREFGEHVNHLNEKSGFFREKWRQMTPEERRKFFKHRHFGHGFFDGQNTENKESK
ncbi:MAG: hypothetical protein LBG92_08470 [Prevotellaceae bacterium]|nr:hypothetical protein [Prevotellaceae bacterium]